MTSDGNSKLNAAMWVIYLAWYTFFLGYACGVRESSDKHMEGIEQCAIRDASLITHPQDMIPDFPTSLQHSVSGAMRSCGHA